MSGSNEAPPFKLCCTCKCVKPANEFSSRLKAKTGLRSDCKKCATAAATKWRKDNVDTSKAIRRRMTLKQYGLSMSDYAALLEKQGNGCAICGGQCSSGLRLAVDHNHYTGEVRGLLCWHCNTGIGKLKDSPHLVAKAVVYLLN